MQRQQRYGRSAAAVMRGCVRSPQLAVAVGVGHGRCVGHLHVRADGVTGWRRGGHPAVLSIWTKDGYACNAGYEHM